MTIDATKVQNRHILAMLGIGLWSSKKSMTTHISAPQDRLRSNPRLEHLLVHKKPTPAPMTEPLDVPVLKKPTSIPVVQNKAKLALAPISTPSVTPQPQKTDTYHTAALDNSDLVLQKYHLQGVRYAQWILVADILVMDTAAQSVWVSLCQALAENAQKHGVAYHTHQVHYPFVIQDDYLEHQTLSPSQDVFLGFMFRLSLAAKHSGTKVAFLTPLPKGVSYPNLYQLPSIDDMVNQNTLKKQLWQMVTSKNPQTQE